MIRFDTTNPPGNETPCLEYVAGVLRQDGIDYSILESAPTRGNLVARLKGNGSKPPFMMMGHVDVVPVEHDKWTKEPFGGDIIDGYVYGRGALDMKNIDAIQLEVLLLLHRERDPLARDIIFMLNADEEIGGRWGAQWMQEQHPDMITAAAGITELGGNAFEFGGKRFFMVQTGEKAGAGFTIRARGTITSAGAEAALPVCRGVPKTMTVSLGLKRPPEPAYGSIGTVTSMRPLGTRVRRCASAVGASSWPPLRGATSRWPTTWSTWLLLTVVAATSCGRLTRATLMSSACSTASAGKSWVTRSTACVPGTSWLRPMPSAASDSSARPAPSTTRVSGRRVVRKVRHGVKRGGGLVTPLPATKSRGMPDVDEWITIAPPAALRRHQQNMRSRSVRLGRRAAAKNWPASWSQNQWTRTSSPVRHSRTSHPRCGSQRQSRARCSRSSCVRFRNGKYRPERLASLPPRPALGLTIVE